MTGFLWLAGCVAAVGPSVAGANGAKPGIDRGMQFLAARDYTAARSELVKARTLQSGDEAALAALAVAADLTGDFRLADRAYDKLLTSATDRAMLFNNMGYSFMLRGELETALDYLTEASRLQPDNPTIRNNLAMLRRVTVR